MAATKGNKWWMNRAKHGRDRIFATPADLWEAACQYFIFTDQRKWNRVDYKGKNTERIEIPTDTPYTITGLCLFLGVSKAFFRQFRASCAQNPNPLMNDFSSVIEAIDNIIYTQKFEGAATGAFNANIISRDLGLIDKQSVEATGEPQNLDMSRLTDRELKIWSELLKKVTV